MTGEQLVESAKKWADDEHVGLLEMLIEDEEDFIFGCTPMLAEVRPMTVEELASQNGLDDPEYIEDFGFTVDEPAREKICKYLNAYPAHGEFIGNVTAAMEHLPEADREYIKGALKMATLTACENGVDH